MPLDTVAAGAVTTSTCTHSGALYGLLPEWQQLWSRCPDATPFQFPGWQVAWWRHFGRGGLWTLTFREPGGRLVGVAPLYLHTRDGLRTVRLVGAGLSDYLDVLAEPEWAAGVVDALVKELAAHPERWDVAESQQLPAHSPLLHTSGTNGDETAPGEPCPRLAISLGCGSSESASAADEALPTGCGSDGLRAHLAQDRRRLSHAFGDGVAFETASRENAARLFAELRRHHGARWSARGKPGVLSDEDVWHFHEEAARSLFEGGLVRLHALRAGGAVRGAYYGFLHGRRAYYYLGGFDPQCRQYGIGNLLVAHAIAVAVHEGATTFDFLRGQENYKYRWGAQDAPTFHRRLYRDPVLRHGAPDIFQPRVESHDSATGAGA